MREFDNIGGLKVRAPVKSAGVVVGRVDGIAFDQQNFLAKVTVRHRQPLQVSEGHDGVDPDLGLARRAIHRPRSRRRHGQSRSGDEIKLTQSAVVLEKLIGQFLYGKAAEGGTKK